MDFKRSYEQSFSEKTRQAHEQRLLALDHNNPLDFQYEIQNAAPQETSLIFICFQLDISGILSCQTGIIASCNFHIHDGLVILKKVGAEERGISVFWIYPTASNTTNRLEELSSIFLQFKSYLVEALHTRAFIFDPVLSRIAEKLKQMNVKQKRNQPILLTCNHIDTHQIEITVAAEDTHFFLFFVTYGLFTLDISIQRIHIQTHNTQISDVFVVHDPHVNNENVEERKKTISMVVLLTKQLSQNLNAAPDPGKALARFMQLIKEITSKKATYFMQELLTEQTKQHDLALLLGFSDFLWEDFLRLQYETLRNILEQSQHHVLLSAAPADLSDRLDDYLGDLQSLEEKLQRINDFKDQENFLIDVDHILHKNLNFFFLSERLSALADIVLEYVARFQWEAHVHRYGTPRTAAGKSAEWCIFGLGKLGGAALGYASDLEILCLYSDSGYCDKKTDLSNHEFFEHLFKAIAGSIHAKQEGIFRIDLRLRPYGESGPLAVSLAKFISYYQPNSEAHSLYRLALTRLRPIAGSKDLARRVLAIRDSVLYKQDSINIEEIRDARNLQIVSYTHESRLNAKFSPGALVDTEYNVQLLQIRHGKTKKRLRTPSIHAALRELASLGVIRVQDSDYMIEAYAFHRRLNNSLRMLRGNATDLFIPEFSSLEFKHLARRMNYQTNENNTEGMQLYLDFQMHAARVRQFVETHLGESALPKNTKLTIFDLLIREEHYSERVKLRYFNIFNNPLHAYRNLKSLASQHRHSPQFSVLLLLTWGYLEHSIDPDLALNNLELFIARLEDPEQFYTEVLAQPYRLEILITILSISPFLAMVLAAHPEHLTWLAEQERLRAFRDLDTVQEELQNQFLLNPQQDRAAIISTFRRRELLRIATRDMLLNIPFQTITQEISNLAVAILRAYISELIRGLDKQDAIITNSLCIFAFGKLGARELNYSSDIDILAVYTPTGNTQEHVKIARRFRNIVQMLSKTTPSGRSYRIDLRLQPHGDIGSIVHTDASIIKYYKQQAAFWELQAALKLSPIAGNLAFGEKLVQSIRNILTERLAEYTGSEIWFQVDTTIQSIRKHSKIDTDEHHPRFDVKRSSGGIRDIEFLVQALQLIHRGDLISYSYGSLACLEELLHLKIISQEEAQDLAKQYITLRKIEHILQIFEDKQIHSIPDDAALQLKIGRIVFSDSMQDRDEFHKEITHTRTRIRSLCKSIRERYQ